MSLLQLLNAPLLFEAYYKPLRIRTNCAPSGAYGYNIAYEQGKIDHWFVEEQREGIHAVQAGVLRKLRLGTDGGAVDLGWRIFCWGFGRQGPAGDFPGCRDKYHSTSFFLEAVARALLLQQETGDPAYTKLNETYTPKLVAGVRWMTRPGDVQAFRDTGALELFTHRYFYLASLFAFTAKLTQDENLYQFARDLVLEGMAKQTPIGVLPERGGYDFGYQAVAMECAARYYVVCPDPDIRKKLLEMLLLAMTFQLTKLDGAGNVDLSDSTRIGKEKTRDGNWKQATEKSIFISLVYLGSITGNDEFTRLAEEIGWRQGYFTRKDILSRRYGEHEEKGT